MSLLSGAPPPPPRSRAALWAGAAAFVVVAVAVVLWLRRPAPSAAPMASPTPAVRPTPAARPTPEPTPEAARPHRAAPAPARPAQRVPRLRITADVEGASVFVDRRHVGMAPVALDDVTPGSHRINVSAQGYEMYAETIDVGEAPVEVDVRFKEVHLDESLAVIHKHGIGSCSGRLVATTAGLAYQTDKQDDAFSVGFEALEPLTVDYLRKNLRVKIRGGRTYNFTVADGSADPLLVFQKKVEDARRRLRTGS